MRQLGHKELERQPGRNEPSEEEFCAPLRSGRETGRSAEPSHHRTRKEGQPNQYVVSAGRSAVPLLAAIELRQQIMADRARQEVLVRVHRDRDEPREYQDAKPEETWQRPECS